MATHDFTLVLDHEPADGDLDELYDAGLSDAVVEHGNGTTLAHFTRDAETLHAAVVSALHDVERAGFTAQAVVSDDLVSLKEIAGRIGRTYESVRLLATGQRGPGGFPPPLSSGGGWVLYSWAQVSAWFTDVLGTACSVTEYDRLIAAADHLVRARAMLRDRLTREAWADLLREC